MHFKDKVVVVTGASRGIGAEIVRAFAAQGAKLVLTARSSDDLESLRQSSAPEAVVVQGDIRDHALAPRLLAESEALGGCDVLINNAGLESFEGYLQQPWEVAQAVLEVNLVAPMRLTRSFLPGMLARGRGHVVNVASLAGLAGVAFGESYCASKHGLVGFTRALRATLLEQGAPVSVSVVCPGFVSDVGMYTEMLRVGGVRAPATLGTSAPLSVARAVLDAARNDRACVIVNPTPIAPLIALGALWPKLAERLVKYVGGNKVFAATARGRAKALETTQPRALEAAQPSALE